MLYYSHDLKEPANHDNVKKAFYKSLYVLYHDNYDYKNIHLVLTDSAQYMKKFVKIIKKSKFFPNLSHITCLAHALHRVSSKVQDKTPKLYNFIVNFNQFLKPIKIRNQFKKITKLIMPPKFISTRWGSYLTCSNFYFQNFKIIKKFINTVKTNKNTYHSIIKAFINNRKSIQEFNYTQKFKI